MPSLRTDTITFHLPVPACITRQHFPFLAGAFLWRLIGRIIARLSAPSRHVGVQWAISVDEKDRTRRRKGMETDAEMGMLKLQLGLCGGFGYRGPELL